MKLSKVGIANVRDVPRPNVVAGIPVTYSFTSRMVFHLWLPTKYAITTVSMPRHKPRTTLDRDAPIFAATPKFRFSVEINEDVADNHDSFRRLSTSDDTIVHVSCSMWYVVLLRR